MKEPSVIKSLDRKFQLAEKAKVTYNDNNDDKL